MTNKEKTERSKVIRSNLCSMGEDSYRDFSAKLMPTVPKDKVLGIRTPILRKFAKNLVDFEGFLQDLPHVYYEENNLHAFLIERERDFERCVNLLNAFLPYVDNWATCDSMKPKVLKRDLDRLLIEIKRWILSKHPYTVRYAINLLMSFYLDEWFDPRFLHMVGAVSSEEYYVNMMRAWYFATALAKQYEETVAFLEKNTLDVWTHNKTIQKARESFRITPEQKDFLNTLKR
ncbi:MAG: DNA alkylation repair protein [Oscillospiraceae bacterium]|nr:DNA alkylation repair protein [Oscillospiraceae bacterium]